MAAPLSPSASVFPGASGTDADFEGWAEKASPWDVVYLAQQPLPGVCTLSGPGVEHSIDIKKASGKDGATITDLGRDLAKFTIKVLMWHASQWDALRKMRASLQPLTSGRKLKPVDVQHPALDFLGIASVYVKRVGIPQIGSKPGTVEVELECLEFRLPSAGDVTTTPDHALDITNHDANAPNFETADGKQLRVAAAKPSATSSGP